MKRFLNLQGMVVIAALAFMVGCSDDDTPSNNNNNNTGTPINILLRVGDTFTYDSWDIDASGNNIDTSYARIFVRYKQGFPIGGYSNVTVRERTNLKTTAKEEFNLTTNSQSDVLMYGFLHEYVSMFFTELQAQAGVTPPSIKGAQWDMVAHFNGTDGKPLATGTEWEITDPNDAPYSVTISGVPVNFRFTVKGKYEGPGEDITVKTKQVKTWKVVITAVVQPSAGVITPPPINIRLSFWYSDDPDGYIKFRQDYIQWNSGIPGVPQLKVNGFTEILVDYL